jgi:hypothetical protein
MRQINRQAACKLARAHRTLQQPTLRNVGKCLAQRGRDARIEWQQWQRGARHVQQRTRHAAARPLVAAGGVTEVNRQLVGQVARHAVRQAQQHGLQLRCGAVGQ